MSERQFLEVCSKTSDDAEDAANIIIELALSSVDYQKFKQVMENYSRMLKQAADAVDDMGL